MVDNTAIPQSYSLTSTNTNGSAFVITSVNSTPVATAPVVPMYGHSQNFTNTGSTSSFSVPAGATSVTLEVWGGADGYNDYGGYAKGTLAVASGDVLSIVLGSHGFYNGGDASIKRVGGSNLVLATEGWDAAGADYDIGYGYTYAGVTNPSTAGGIGSGGARALIGYFTPTP